jgi:4-aminobutyrate aminotransferase-like enzyme
MLIGVGGVGGNVVRFQPPLVITRQQVDQALAIFSEALQEVAQPAHATA